MSLAPAPPRPEAAATLRAALWMLGAVLAFSSMAVAGRAVSFELDTFEIMMYRSVVGFVLVLAVAWATGHARSITTRSPGLHLVRNISHFTGQNLWFYAITMIPLAQVFALDWDGYRDSVGAVVQYTHMTGRGQALTVSGQYNRLNYAGQPLLDADRFAAAVGYVTQNVSASVQGGKEETRRLAGDHYSNWFANASIGAEVPLGESLALVAGAAFDLRRYDAADPLFLVERSDERLDLQAGLKVRLTGNLFLQPRVTYTRNWSNIALYDYDRWTASAGLRFEF